MTCELILGGARSGKSHYAETLARESGLPVTMIVTAAAGDDEMSERIAAHQARRPEHWATVEAPVHLGHALLEHAGPRRCLVVDCLTVWLSNLLCACSEGPHRADDPGWQAYGRERALLLAALPSLTGRVLLVANEVGLGLVPMTPLGRVFRDEAGRLNQEIARICPRATFIAAGLPLVLKDG